MSKVKLSSEKLDKICRNKVIIYSRAQMRYIKHLQKAMRKIMHYTVKHSKDLTLCKCHCMGSLTMADNPIAEFCMDGMDIEGFIKREQRYRRVK